MVFSRPELQANIYLHTWPVHSPEKRLCPWSFECGESELQFSWESDKLNKRSKLKDGTEDKKRVQPCSSMVHLTAQSASVEVPTMAAVEGFNYYHVNYF